MGVCQIWCHYRGLISSFHFGEMIQVSEERFFFERLNLVDIDAAAIGISRWSWDSIDSSRDDWMQVGSQIIKERRYDVLPIEKDSTIESYLCLGENGEYKEIQISDSIHFRTPALGSLSSLVNKGRNHIFLHNDAHIIVGLLSASNYNCREFATVVFNIITAYESAVANAIRKNAIQVPETEEYLIAKEMNLEVDPVESLNFSALMNVFSSNYALFSDIYGNLAKSRTKLKRVIEKHILLRNDVAHIGAGRVLIGEGKRDVIELHTQLVEIRSLTALLSN